MIGNLEKLTAVNFGDFGAVKGNDSHNLSTRFPVPSMWASKEIARW